MQGMIDAITAAIAKDATPEQRAAGVQACRTILAALDAEAGKPIALPGTPQPSPLAELAPEQVLDLLIARLRTLVPEPGGAPEQPTRARGQGVRFVLVEPPPRNAGSRAPGPRRKR